MTCKLEQNLICFRYEKIADKWDEPQPKPYKDYGNLQWYLLEPDCFDQYSVVFQAGDRTAVMLNSIPEPQTIEERQVQKLNKSHNFKHLGYINFYCFLYLTSKIYKFPHPPFPVLQTSF